MQRKGDNVKNTACALATWWWRWFRSWCCVSLQRKTQNLTQLVQQESVWGSAVGGKRMGCGKRDVTRTRYGFARYHLMNDATKQLHTGFLCRFGTGLISHALHMHAASSISFRAILIFKIFPHIRRITFHAFGNAAMHIRIRMFSFCDAHLVLLRSSSSFGPCECFQSVGVCVCGTDKYQKNRSETTILYEN